MNPILDNAPLITLIGVLVTAAISILNVRKTSEYGEKLERSKFENASTLSVMNTQLQEIIQSKN